LGMIMKSNRCLFTSPAIISTHIWCISILLTEHVLSWRHDVRTLKTLNCALKVSCLLFTLTNYFLKSFGCSCHEAIINWFTCISWARMHFSPWKMKEHGCWIFVSHFLFSFFTLEHCNVTCSCTQTDK
jgi:hypothetical protein